MQEFHIRKNSLNPVLEMELIKDGRYDFIKSLMNNALQDSVVTFSMKDAETGLLKVSKGKVNILLTDEDTCEEHYILQYKWNKKDVNRQGVFEGWFEIKFNGDIVEDGVDYPEGNLIIPVQEKLMIYID